MASSIAKPGTKKHFQKLAQSLAKNRSERFFAAMGSVLTLVFRAPITIVLYVAELLLSAVGFEFVRERNYLPDKEQVDEDTLHEQVKIKVKFRLGDFLAQAAGMAALLLCARFPFVVGAFSTSGAHMQIGRIVLGRGAAKLVQHALAWLMARGILAQIPKLQDLMLPWRSAILHQIAGYLLTGGLAHAPTPLKAVAREQVDGVIGLSEISVGVFSQFYNDCKSSLTNKQPVSQRLAQYIFTAKI